MREESRREFTIDIGIDIYIYIYIIGCMSCSYNGEYAQ